ncbi:MAG: DNA repair protein RecO [Alphaproteobacteria bacterium]|nr:DNA repair protein RecO [Alphaproteobacteria bacterium]
MNWADTAIILSTRRHGENSAVVRVFSMEHGVYAGVLRAANSKAQRGVAQISNIVSATWNARLAEQLGTFKFELLVPSAAHFMQDGLKLTALVSACTIIESALPERHPYPRLYRQMLMFLDSLEHDENWQRIYIELEMAILAESGFGLDLSRCAATDRTDDLIYVSPKSGRAVCREAGEPYKDRLLELPQFLLSRSPLGGEQASASAQHEARAVRGSEPEWSNIFFERARTMRKEATPAEQKLWPHLSNRNLSGYKFRRQHPIGHKYIADFVCLERRVIIELDGEQHAHQQDYDDIRTVFLENEGYQVLRFWNPEVMNNINNVLETILHTLQKPLTLRPTPPAGACPQPLSPKGRAQEEILAGMRLTGYFLESWLLGPHKKQLPATRGRLIKLLEPSENSTNLEIIDVF